MRSLFRKIFLWFWMAFLIVAVTLIVITVRIRSNEVERDQVKTKGLMSMPFVASQAVRIYERDGKTGLKRYFDTLKEEGVVALYLLDQSGKDVLGGKPPVRAVQFAKSAKGTSPIFTGFVGREGFFAQQASGANGNEYTSLVVISLPPVAASLKGLGANTLLSVLAVLSIGGLFCFCLARHIVYPVEQLSEAAHSIADGELDARCDGRIRSRRDEIGQLGESFDRMAERIESLVRGQQRLFRDVSHELRSPLTRLSVAEGLLRQCPSEERAEYLDRIALEIEHLDHLIGQLLTLARIDHGDDPGHQEKIQLSNLIQEIAVDGSFEARAKHCAVRVESFESCTTRGTSMQLRRAIENVVRNAIYYTPSGTDVEITVRKEIAAVIQVRDYGPGVPDECLEKIFLPFYRVPAITGEPIRGTGLGLAITERIIRMHGGRVSATNAPGRGFVIRLEIPLIE